MMNVFDLLYYSFYCLVIKKEHETGEERAAFMLSGTTSTLLMALYFVVSTINKGNLLAPWALFIAGVTVYLVNGIWTSRYFVRSGRYKKVIDTFSQEKQSQRKIYAIVAFLLMIGSFVLFAFAGYKFGQNEF